MFVYIPTFHLNKLLSHVHFTHFLLELSHALYISRFFYPYISLPPFLPRAVSFRYITHDHSSYMHMQLHVCDLAGHACYITHYEPEYNSSQSVYDSPNTQVVNPTLSHDPPHQSSMECTFELHTITLQWPSYNYMRMMCLTYMDVTVTLTSMLPTLAVERIIGRPTREGKMCDGKLEPA